MMNNLQQLQQGAPAEAGLNSRRPRGIFGGARFTGSGANSDVSRQYPGSNRAAFLQSNNDGLVSEVSPYPGGGIGGDIARRNSGEFNNVPEAGTGEQTKRPSFFGQGGIGRGLAGIIGDTILLQQGRDMMFAPQQMKQQELMRQRQYEAQQAAQARMEKREDYERTRRDKFDDTIALKDYDLNAPQYFMSGKDRVSFDPATGESNVLYDGPEQFEVYAQALGYEPGTPEYENAIRDAMLKSSGPTAYDYRTSLDDYRTNNDIRRKGAPTYRQSNPAPRRGGGRRPNAGVTAKAGERSITTADGRKQVVRNGKWVDAR